jgi:hypothetical protein
MPRKFANPPRWICRGWSRRGSSRSAAAQNAGLLVVRNGWLVFEKYVGRASRNVNPDMASTGKAYTSIACGIMLQEFRDKIPDVLDTKLFTRSTREEREGSRAADDGIRPVLKMVCAGCGCSSTLKVWSAEKSVFRWAELSRWTCCSRYRKQFRPA